MKTVSKGKVLSARHGTGLTLASTGEPVNVPNGTRMVFHSMSLIDEARYGAISAWSEYTYHDGELCLGAQCIPVANLELCTLNVAMVPEHVELTPV